MAKSKTGTTSRYRNFSTVVYPESAPEKWMDILADQKIPAMVSPLHDKDINPGGEVKKPHHHVIFAFEGVKTLDQVEEIIKLIGGVGCEVIKSLRAYTRYLCHLDNPDKAQYSQEEVRTFGGIDYYQITELAIDKYKAIWEMKDFCERYDIVSFYLLDRYAQQYRPDWSRVLADTSTLHMKEWLMSRKWSRDMGMMVIVDPSTGEVAFDFGREQNG